MREFAWRVFAGELNSADLEYSEGGERAPSYLVTPLGAKVNRILAVGVLTELENQGSDTEPMWKARLSDPTGTFYITSGRYQPEASATFSKLQPPEFISLIGKVRAYSPEQDVVYVSVRPEKVMDVDSYIRDHWILDACKSLKNRLEMAKEAMGLETLSKDKLMSLGCREELADGMVLARDHYKDVELDRYESMLADAARYLLEEDIDSDAGAPARESADPKKEEGEEDKEDGVLRIIEKLDKDGKGASWDEVVSQAKKMKIAEDELEELTNILLGKGRIYEPVLGKIKKA